MNLRPLIYTVFIVLGGFLLSSLIGQLFLMKMMIEASGGYNNPRIEEIRK